MSKLLVFLDKILLYLIFFIIAVNCHGLVTWFSSMSNMTAAMILMVIVMVVDKGWELYHAK